MSITTYLRPNIHQNGPEILGLKLDNYFYNSWPITIVDLKDALIPRPIELPHKPYEQNI
jgi:hypothetical protein